VNLHKLSVSYGVFHKIAKQNLPSVKELVVFDQSDYTTELEKIDFGWKLKTLRVVAHHFYQRTFRWGDGITNWVGYGQTAIRGKRICWRGVWEAVSHVPFEVLIIDGVFIQKTKFDREFQVKTSAKSVHLIHLRLNFEYFIDRLDRSKTDTIIFEKCKLMDLLYPVSVPNIKIIFVGCRFKHPTSQFIPSNK
jgi:hypothetical protein